ncbi:MAG: hypothetical protein HW402_1463 [Dehalococcoidales bacterium]|nr:hypothetical protein [Dehalococcoidales bacterium]
MSLPYSVAIALIEGKALPEQYAEEKLKTAQVIVLSQKVRITSDASLPRGVSCAMKIVMMDGTAYEAQVDYAKGSLENPMTDEEHRAKFSALASLLLSKKNIAQIVDVVAKLEELEDISPLCRLIY